MRTPIPALTRIGQYIVEDVADYGGSSITYWGRDGAGNNVVILKEYYPVIFAGDLERGKEDGLLRIKADIRENRKQEIQTAFARALRQENEQAAGISLVSLDGVLNNNPLFFTPNDVISYGLERFTVVRTEAGRPLSRCETVGATAEERISDALNTVTHLLRILSELHKTTLHLDIKPANIWVSHDETEKLWQHPLRLFDFGSSLKVDETGHAVMGEGHHFSTTLDFASPDVIDVMLGKSGVNIIKVDSDVYSAVCVLRTLIGYDDLLLPNPVRELLSSVLYELQERDAGVTAAYAAERLEELVQVVEHKGIHPVFFRMAAEKQAKKFENEIDPRLLPEIEEKHE